jgi:hypothetical protein
LVDKTLGLRQNKAHENGSIKPPRPERVDKAGNGSMGMAEDKTMAAHSRLLRTLVVLLAAATALSACSLFSKKAATNSAHVRVSPSALPKSSDAQAPANSKYEPGWSVNQRGVAWRDRRLDPHGVVNQGLLRQALARIDRETKGQDLSGEAAVIDYSLPADRPRLFLVNLKSGGVRSLYVSHGHAKRYCGKVGCIPRQGLDARLNVPVVTSAANSDATSLGLYRVLDTKAPGCGAGKACHPKAVLAGLDPSNATALARGIIIHHNGNYFDPKRKLFGRSQGCFVVGPDDINPLLAALPRGSFIYAGMGPHTFPPQVAQRAPVTQMAAIRPAKPIPQFSTAGLRPTLKLESAQSAVRAVN